MRTPLYLLAGTLTLLFVGCFPLSIHPTYTDADLLMDKLQAKGVGVIIEASHTCMTIRGVKTPGATMVTSSMLGSFRKNIATRNEAMNLLMGNSR